MPPAVKEAALETAQADRRHRHVERRPGVAAVGAAVVAEVAEVDRLVAVGVAATHARGGVGGVGEVGERHRRIVEAEPDHVAAAVAERADDGIVGGEHEQRLGRQLADHRPPALGHQLQLAVAVELVAEQVRERARAAGCGERSRAARTRPPRTGPAARRPRRSAARWRRRRGGSRRRRCGRARARAPARRRPARSWSSCRWWPRPARRRLPAAPRGARWRRAPGAAAPCRAGSCRRHARCGATATRSRARRPSWRGRGSRERIVALQCPYYFQCVPLQLLKTALC